MTNVFEIDWSAQADLLRTAADLQAEWTTNDATIDVTFPTILRAGAVALEIKAGSSGGGGPQVDPNQSTIAVAPSSITAVDRRSDRCRGRSGRTKR